MGNALKARLHLRKKEDRPSHDHTEHTMTEHINPPRNQIDNNIMSGPNRARVAEANASDSASVPAHPTRGIDTTATTTTTAATTARART